MAKHKLIDTDEALDGNSVIFYTSEQEHYVPKDLVLQYIEEQCLNTYTTGNGLTSDPYAREETVTVSAEEYYQDNFDYVTEQYFKFIING